MSINKNFLLLYYFNIFLIRQCNFKSCSNENVNLKSNAKENDNCVNLKKENKEENSDFSREISKMLDFTNTNKVSNTSLLNKKRRKFDIIHDHLLMLGLFNHGKR